MPSPKKKPEAYARDPGPWRVESPRNDSHAYDVYSADGTKLHHGHWGGEATAHLIAAAPDLLEALETFLARLEDGRPEVTASAMEEWAAEIRAVISKARGGA